MNALSGAESIEEYYQLSHDPFAARTPGFKFFTPQRKTVLAQLHHLARFGDQVLLVAGPEGSGKTLLRQALVASSNKDTTQCVVTTAREFANAGALMSFFCQAVNASGRDAQALLLRADQLHETGISLYLIIDDAHLLEQDALQELVELSQVGGSDVAVRVFLFADDSVQPMLDRVSAEEEGAQWLHLIMLQPYNLDETREYLAQRLEGAGQGLELLDESQIQWIHRHSGGWPGRVNEAARQSMREAMEEQESPAKAGGFVLRMKSLLAVVLIAIGIGFAWFMGDRQEEPVTTVLELPEPVVPVDVTDDPELAELSELNAVPGVSATGATSERDAEIAPAERSATVNLFPSAGANLNTEADVARSAAGEAAELPTQIPPAEGEPAVASRTAPAERTPPAEVSTPTIPEPVSKSESESEPEPEPEPTQASAAPVAPASGGAASGAGAPQWYQAQEAGRYVLQVLGSHSQEAAKDFIANNPGVADLRFFQTTHQGKPWFVVTQGNYASRQQAQQAVARLPEQMRRASPWPRSVGDIKQALEP